jgi:hypothetical protein
MVMLPLSPRGFTEKRSEQRRTVTSTMRMKIYSDYVSQFQNLAMIVIRIIAKAVTLALAKERNSG